MTDTRALAERIIEVAKSSRGSDDPDARLHYRNTASAYGALVAQAYLAASTENAALERRVALYQEVVDCARVQYDVYGAYDKLRYAINKLDASRQSGG